MRKRALVVSKSRGTLVQAARRHLSFSSLSQRIADWMHPPKPSYAPRIVTQSPEEAARQLAFTFCSIALTAKVACANGRLTRESFIAFRGVFPLDDAESAKLRELFNLACEDTAPPGYFVERILSLYPRQQALWRDVLKHLAAVAQSDGPLSTEELRLITLIGEAFGFTRPIIARAISSAADPHESDPFRVLGLPRGIGVEELKAQYRTLMREYHPDRIAHSIRYPEALEVAKRRTVRINEAYSELMRRRAFRRAAS